MPIDISYTIQPFSTLYDDVLPEIPGAQLSLVDQKIREAGIDLCKQALVWRETLDGIGIGAGLLSYPLDPPTQAIFWRPYRVALDARPLSAMAPGDIDLLHPDWRTKGATPLYYFVEPDDTLCIAPLPAAGGVMEVDAALAPSNAATGLPSLLFTYHRQLIAKGAKAKLMLMGKKSWTDRELGAKYESEFNCEIGSMAFRVAGRGAAPLRVTTCHGVK